MSPASSQFCSRSWKLPRQPRLTQLKSAGSRDSALTAHGVLQTQRLGAHLASLVSSIGRVGHIFSSDLQRAARTAQAIVDAQGGTSSISARPMRVTKLSVLRERDFRSAEGMSFGSRADRPSMNDAETYNEMRIRAESFLRTFLRPILLQTASPSAPEQMVVVVSHGIFLGVLLDALASRFSVPNFQRSQYSAWSNTGYHQFLIRHSAAAEGLSSPRLISDMSARQSPADGSLGGSLPRPSVPASPMKTQLVPEAINSLVHLQGLKKTRGGIGSAKFDEKQKTMDTFLRPASKKPGPG